MKTFDDPESLKQLLQTHRIDNAVRCIELVAMGELKSGRGATWQQQAVDKPWFVELKENYKFSGACGWISTTGTWTCVRVNLDILLHAVATKHGFSDAAELLLSIEET